MELKDVILSTLAEMDESLPDQPSTESSSTLMKAQKETVFDNAEQEYEPELIDAAEDETRYLESVKERLLVLFEGFQSPNNVQIEAKIDLTLNFLEYLLATIDTRIEKLKKSRRL